MSIIGRIDKQPIEEKEYRVNYNGWLLTDETLDTVDIVVTPAGGLTAEDIIIDPIKARDFLVVFRNGDDAVNYKVEITVTTNPPENRTSRVKQDELFVSVAEQ